MKQKNYIGKLAALVVHKLWQEKIGIRYNTERNIICRFYPSCSNYAILVFEKHGFIVGFYLAAKRVLKCTPNNTDSCIDIP